MGTYNYPYYMEKEKTGEYIFPNATTWRSADGESLNAMFKKAKKQGLEGNFKSFVKASTELGFLNAVGAKDDAATKTAFDAYQALAIINKEAPLSFDKWYAAELEKDKSAKRSEIISKGLEYGQKTIDILSNLFGKKTATPDYGTPPPPAATKSNTGLYVGIGVAVLAVGVASYFILKPKN